MRIKKNEEYLIEDIAGSDTFVAITDVTYLHALEIPDSKISKHVKLAKMLNKPVILIIDRALSPEGKLYIERYFSGYNVIKAMECDIGDESEGEAAIDEIEKLTREVAINKILSKMDFIRIDLDPIHYYYSFRSGVFEICLEPCAGGFCTAAYDKDIHKLEPGKCTDQEGYLDSPIAMFGDRREDTWNKALETANDLYQRIFIPDLKKNPVKIIGFQFGSK